MLRLSFCLSFLLFLSFYSCNKNDIPESISINADYFPLSVGNVWRYKLYRVDSDSTKYPYVNSLDSIFIESDTIINDELYYKMIVNTCLTTGCSSLTNYVRYNNGVLTDHYGRVTFSSIPSAQPVYTDTTIVLSELYISEFSVSDQMEWITIDLGIFNCIDWIGSVRLETADDIIEKPSVHYYYAENTGLVQSVFYSYNGDMYTRNLVSFDIN